MAGEVALQVYCILIRKSCRRISSQYTFPWRVSLQSPFAGCRRTNASSPMIRRRALVNDAELSAVCLKPSSLSSGTLQLPPRKLTNAPGAKSITPHEASPSHDCRQPTRFPRGGRNMGLRV